MDEYVEANRRLWNEWAHINAASAFYDIEAFKRGGNRLRPYEIEDVGDVRGKDLLHLQCHFGMDTLSWARLGANVTGADFSSESIELARTLAAEVGLPARFVCSDLADLPSSLEGDFDVVYTSRGVLGWLPDLTVWASTVAHFVRPGGIFYITEAHPLLWTFDDDEDVKELRFRYSYFGGDALAFPTKGSYADRDAEVKEPFEYGWNHSLGDIVTSLAGAGLAIEFLREDPFVEWPVPFLEEREDGTWRLPQGHPELPLFFSLKAAKPGRS
ncbi:MAG TPA: class I SAM-dependent methyltransferase [Actinomycetota bacterium]|nr:class I SAM-dependent methyltransferase [Actinomycetota bacterium]